MSRRVLGGGRILGSRNSSSLTPTTAAAASSSLPTPKSPSPLPQHVLSPSASTTSLTSASHSHDRSQSSTPPSADPIIDQDIESNLSLTSGRNGTITTFAASSAAASLDRLACPICNEEMVTLLQLNRHLDDAHKEIEEEKQDEVKDWFRAQMGKAKKFQPLAVLNSKLKGLDVFESNNEGTRSGSVGGHPRAGSDATLYLDGSGATAPTRATGTATSTPPPNPAQVDPDEVVKKDHWQKRGYTDACSDPMCGRRLGNTYGSVNCRHCGKLFCEEHSMYQMKLSRSAQHEPVRGFWCRVCETCYKSRDGYTDRHGLERNHMSEFQKIRQAKLDKTYLEVSRLEKRLTRLTQLLANPPEEISQTTSKRWSLTLSSWAQNDPKKALEQSVVPWQEDAEVARCPYCQQDFSQYTFRRHHCRTCGKVVCGDPATGCSIMLGLNVASTDGSLAIEKPSSHSTIPLDIRLCKDCNFTIFYRRDFAAGIADIPPSVRAYHNLIQFERGIRLLLPRFQKLLQALQDPENPPSSTQIADASRTRKRLMDSFTQYDIAARRIRDMPTDSPTQQKLQKAIYQQASQFLHLHMLPLKTLPKILKHATPHGKAIGMSSPLANGASAARPVGALAAIHYASHSFDSSSQISATSATSSAISALEAEEKTLRERLIVLEEQKFMVSEMVADANRRRKFDEVAALAGNVEDLSQEIDQVQGLISGLDFEGVYNTGTAGGGLGSGTVSPMRTPTPLNPKVVDKG